MVFLVFVAWRYIWIHVNLYGACIDKTSIRELLPHAHQCGFNPTLLWNNMLQEGHNSVLLRWTPSTQRNHAIILKNWVLFECCFAFRCKICRLHRRRLKCCQTSPLKNDYMVNPKFEHTYLPPVHNDDELKARTTLFEARRWCSPTYGHHHIM
jgi:hypothetical protein